jgi:hypothetical protein
MNIFSFLEPIQRVSLSLDDSSLALIALLAGMAGGWSLTGLRKQLRAKRTRAGRDSQVSARDAD